MYAPPQLMGPSTERLFPALIWIGPDFAVREALTDTSPNGPMAVTKIPVGAVTLALIFSGLAPLIPPRVDVAVKRPVAVVKSSI